MLHLRWCVNDIARQLCATLLCHRIVAGYQLHEFSAASSTHLVPAYGLHNIVCGRQQWFSGVSVTQYESLLVLFRDCVSFITFVQKFTKRTLPKPCT